MFPGDAGLQGLGQQEPLRAAPGAGGRGGGGGPLGELWLVGGGHVTIIPISHWSRSWSPFSSGGSTTRAGSRGARIPASSSRGTRC